MAYLENFQHANKVKALNRFAQILLAITFIAGLNYLATEHYRRIDLTHQRRYSLSPESQAYIQQIDSNKPVKIIVTLLPNGPDENETLLYTYMVNLLKEFEYAGRSGEGNKIEVEFIDIYRERKKADAFSRKYRLEEPKLALVVCEDRQRMLLPSDLIDIDNNTWSAFKGEQAITTALISVTDTEPQKLYFVVGHGEMRIDDLDPRRGLSQLAEQLGLRNFKLASLDLTQVAEVPEDASLVLLIAPQGPVLGQEVELLRNYLSREAGRLIVMLDPVRKHGLEEMLFEWGVLADDMVIFDAGKDFLSAGGEMLIRQLADHPITNILIKNQIPVVAGLCRPIRPDMGAPIDERLKVTPLMGSSAESWAERSYHDTDTVTFDEDTDLPGPVSIAVVSERKVSSQLGINIPGGRLITFGNSDIVANHRIAYPGNQILFFNAINWCLDRENLLAIPPQPIEKIQFAISRQDIIDLGLMLLTVPGAIAAMGLCVFWIRKH